MKLFSIIETNRSDNPCYTRQNWLVVLLNLFLSFNLTYGQAPENPPESDIQQIFPISKLNKNYIFSFKEQYEEKSIIVSDGLALNAILFHADSSRGVVFFLHGNTGGLDKWGKLAPVYLSLHFDVFMVDYRGYGKSDGSIKNERQLYNDMRATYDSVKSIYSEKKIYILGYSIGTGLATMLASENHPKGLILEAPYYSLSDAIHYLYPTIDTTEMPFQFNTYQFLPKVTCPVIIFHGDVDKTFYYGSSLKLRQFFKPGDKLITLKGADHSDMEVNKEYLKELKGILN
jgi:pimeloyl-ACP methyl ester carboxylesterase